MADIIVQCTRCSEETAISEYADPELAACPKCGGKLNVPRSQAVGPKPPPRREKDKRTGPVPLERTTMTAFKAVSDRQKRIRKRHQWISWSPGPVTLIVLFVLGVLVLGLLRFVILPPDSRPLLAKFGLFCLLVGYLTVVADAFHENVMFGLLCLFVPGYFLYYLFAQCDSYILRLAIGILILPFGPDAFRFFVFAARSVVGFLRSSDLINEDF